MRIAYLLNSEQIGGGNRSLLTLWSAVRPLGINILAVTPRHGPMTAACTEFSIECQVLEWLEPSWRHALRSFNAYRRSLGVLARFNPAVIHSNGFAPSRSISLAAYRAGTPHICHVRFGASKEYLEWVFRRLPKPDVFIFNSHALASEVRPHLEQVCKHSSYEVVHNAVDVTVFKPATRSDGPVRIGIVGNLLPVKGHEDFLRMAQVLRDKGVTAQYWVIGDDIHGTGHGRRLREYAVEVGVDAQTTFFGHRSDIPTLMSQLDVLVCSSHEEPFGRVLIEAMACEKPVVATNVGGIPEVVMDGVTGLVVPPRSPMALAEAVFKVLTCTEFARRLGESGRQRVMALFSADAHAIKIKSIYDRIA